MEKHLEFVQNIITRLSQNSFLIKGWTITLVSAIFVLAQKDSNSNFLMLAYFPTIIFWFLDSYYLKKEREYRNLYEKVRKGEIKNFDLTITKNEKSKSQLSSFLSITIYPFYVIIIIIILFLKVKNFC